VSRIDRHIEILLLENDCVIVPGLGGFVAHHITAKYDETECLFLPPYRTLGFNPQLKVNDSLLAQSFVEAYDIAFPEAMRQIEEEVEAIHRTLNNEGIIELNDLGKLRLTSEHKLEFEPLESGILTPRYYALNSFDFTLKAKSEKQEEKEEVSEALETRKIIYLDVNDPNNKRVSVSLKAIRNVAVAAVLFTAALVVALPLHNKSGITEEPVKSGVLYNFFDSNKSLPTPQTKPVASPIPNKTTTNHYWSLVLASHITENNAIAFAKDINEAGFEGARVYEGTGSIKVLYGNFKSQEEAFKHLNTLKTNKYFKDAWVIEINK
jgi:hypothetical protein